VIATAPEAWSGGGEADDPRALRAGEGILGDAARRVKVKRLAEALAARGEVFVAPG
jgi:hypothetical protein